MSDAPENNGNGGNHRMSPQSVEDDGNIQVQTLISSTGGDLRRTSFILSAIQIAMGQFDITSKSIFQGEWIDKKMCGDFFYKSRFLWFDPSDDSFHWSKDVDRKIPHKRLRMDGRISHVKRDHNFVTQVKEYGLTVSFINGENLCMKWVVEEAGNPKSISAAEAETRITDWMKVFQSLAVEEE